MILSLIMFGSFYKNAAVHLASIMKIGVHLEVGLVFCWVIIAENSNYQNCFIRFLSKKVFIRYAKTTYTLYLIAPIVTIFLYGLKKSGSTYEFPEMVSGTKFKMLVEIIFSSRLLKVIMCYVILKIASRISFLVTTYIELPFCKLSKYILQPQQAKEKTK